MWFDKRCSSFYNSIFSPIPTYFKLFLVKIGDIFLLFHGLQREHLSLILKILKHKKSAFRLNGLNEGLGYSYKLSVKLQIRTKSRTFQPPDEPVPIKLTMSKTCKSKMNTMNW